MDPSNVASAIALTRWLLGMIERRERGEMSEEEFDRAWDRLNVGFDDQDDTWADAVREGGYRN